MKITAKKTYSILGALAASISIFSSTGQQASAGQLYNGWNYGIDAFNDGSGGSNYEIKGMAIKETDDSIFVALNGGTPLAGVADSDAVDGNIGWGDLFFNFSGKDFKTANQEGSLFGIRFASANESKVATTGVYKNVSATSVTGGNQGYSSLHHYYDSGWEKLNSLGTDLPTKQAAYTYFERYKPIENVINSGTKVGDITILSNSALTAAGLNFGYFGANGSQTIGFQFSRSLLPSGDYLSNLFLECGNDGVALVGHLKEVPEPSGIVGLALLGLTATGSIARKRRLENPNTSK